MHYDKVHGDHIMNLETPRNFNFCRQSLKPIALTCTLVFGIACAFFWPFSTALADNLTNNKEPSRQKLVDELRLKSKQEGIRAIDDNKATATTSRLYKPTNQCARSYIYRNREYPVDSARKLDAEGLRPVFKKFSEPTSLLDDYQAQLRTSYIPAYVGSAGLALALGGTIYASQLKTPLGQRDTRYSFLFAGALLAVSSYAYNQFLFTKKERTLAKAVDTYNNLAPDSEKISVQITPNSNVDGGEIRTLVPF